MEILNKKQKIIIIVIIALVLIFIGYYIITKVSNSGYINLETQESENESSSNKDIGEETQERNNVESDSKVSIGNYIIIHVTGAVKKQGIVEIEEGSRISDVIEAAGGATKKADLSKINLAYIVQDGQKIYVPSTDDKEEVSSVTEGAGEKVIKDDGQGISTTTKERININTASQTELETLNGIGPSTALKIINYREQNGKFKTIEDIKNVPGIGDSKYESIKENICV